MMKSASVEIRVIGVVGSLRAGSATRMAVRFVLQSAREAGASVELLDLAAYNLPFLGREREEGNVETVRRFRADLRAADGIILGSPEIHGSISGVLKNALDLVSSEDLEGKMVGVAPCVRG